MQLLTIVHNLRVLNVYSFSWKRLT